MDDVPEITEPPAVRVRLVRAPLVVLALVLAGGVVAGRYLPLPVGLWLAVGLVATATALISLRREHLRRVAGLAVAVAVLAIGAARLHTAYFSVPRDHILTYTASSGMLATVRGRVASWPQIFRPEVEFGYHPGPRVLFLLEAEEVKTDDGWAKTGGLVRVSINEPYKTFRPGDRLELVGWMGRFRRPDNPGEFDSAAAARLSGTWVHFKVPAADGAELLVSADAADLAARLVWKMKAAMRQHLLESGDLRSGRLLCALILGERHKSLASLNRTMQRAGISHFLSISGLHLGVFLGFVYALCRLAMLRPRRSAAVVLVVLACYLLLAEPRPPLLRSAIMAAALLVGVMRGRRNSSLNALAAAMIILLLIDPRQLFGGGFQMSFAIVAGLILLYRPVRNLLFGRWLRRRGLMVFRGEHRVRRWMYFSFANRAMDIVTISVTAYVISAPLAAVHFGIFSPFAVVLNVLFFPLVVAVLVPGYLSMGLAPVAPNLSDVVGDLAGGSAWLLGECVEALGSVGFLCVSLRPMGLVWVGLCYATLVMILFAGRNRRRRVVAGGLAVMLLAVTVWSQWPGRPAKNTAQLDLLSVGAGQCAVLQTPDGRTFLFDAGTRSGFDVCRCTLLPFLRTERLPAPGEAIISHANTDHYNALPAMVRRGGLRRVYLCDYFDRGGDGAYSAPARVMKILRDHGVQVCRLGRGAGLDLDAHTRLDVLWPPGERDDLDCNDTSLVLRITCAGLTVLLPGDLGQAGQAELLKNPRQLRADVLVMPHHGGWEETLPAFIEAVGPKVVLISGRTDPTGPAAARPEVRKFYQDLKRNYRYYSTAGNGWVRLQLSPAGLDVQTMR